MNELIGKIITRIDVSKDKDEIKFYCNDGTKFIMYHDQDCCEQVTIEDICGDINVLIGTPILQAEESTNNDNPKEGVCYESFTWTFYNFATVKGFVTIRWYGESNGYYSESVTFKEFY